MKYQRNPWSRMIAYLLIITICLGASILRLPAVEVQAESTSDGLEYWVNDDQTVMITGYHGSATELPIPAAIDGYPVTGIATQAFFGCSSLMSIDIPDSVTSIGDAFSWSSLSAINVDLNNTVYASVAGVLFNKEMTTLVACPPKKEGAYSIPNSVTSIGDNAFSNCYNLTGIEIPDSVTSIGEFAFSWCSSLTSIEIPDSVTSIGYRAFSQCSSLTGIKISNSVTSIADNAFWGCSSLTSIGIPDSVTSIGRETFLDCSSLTSIKIPGSVTSIGERAFWNCSSLMSIDIPDSVTSIGDETFLRCSSLTAINVDLNNTVYASAAGVLFNKEMTTLVTCPQKKEGTYSIPGSVTSIGEGAFSYCYNLTCIEIPDSVTSIEDAFHGCSNLTALNVDGKNTVYASVAGVLFNKEMTTLVTCPQKKEGTYSIPDSITSIGERAFWNCSSLANIEFPNSVTNIEECAFYGCSSLTSIEIPDSVTDIGDWAFEDCSSLTSIVIPDSVTITGYNPFGGTAVDHVIFSGSKDAWDKLTAAVELFNGAAFLRDATVHYNTEENVFTPEAPVLPDCINNGYTTYKCSLCEKEYRSDFVPPTGHSFQDDICSKCGRSREDCIESAHPYENNADETYTIYRPGAAEIKVTFSSATKLSEGDQIIIYDKENSKIGSYYGNDLASKQIQVPGDTVKIKLVADETTGSAYGFAVSDIEAIMPAIIYGDLDNSGHVDARDALIILKIAAQLQTPTEEQKIAGDVNKSGHVDAKDALDVLKKAAQLIDKFLAEEN